MSTHVAMRDSMTMLRRNLLHARRYPAMTMSIVIMPIFLLLIFSCVYGGAVKGALGGEKYISYLTPGTLLLIPAYMTVSVAVSVCSDMTKGIVNRFRTMAISQASMLTGHVVGALIQSLLGIAAMLGMAFILGFRSSASLVEWVAALGLITLVIFAFIWLSVAFGLIADNPESASNLPFPIVLLPFLGSGLVPTDTMPNGMRQFAKYQPFTPITETVRGLLMGTHIGTSGITALLWCFGIAAVGYFWSVSLFRKKAG